MASAASDRANIVVQHDNLVEFASKRYSGWHASVPILMLLSTVVIAGCVVAAAITPDTLKPMIIAMTILMIGAAGLTFFSIVAHGQVIEAAFDSNKQVARLLYRGPTAHSEWTIPFSRIVDARMNMRYRDDGTKISTPVLELTDGRNIALPHSTTWSDIESIRALVISKQAGAEADAAWAKKNSTRRHVGRPSRS